MTELEKLAARVEAEGPSRELFERAYEAVFGYKPRSNRDCNKRADTFCALLDIGAPEALLGAAMMLVPEGWAFAFSSNLTGPGCVAGLMRKSPHAATDATAPTPAAALCAAALRANQESRNEQG